MEVDKTHERFLSKVEVKDGCWNWIAYIHPQGYGYFYANNKQCKAHRYSYTYYKGKIPKGLVIDHICRNRKCVNPEHLRAITNKENILIGVGSPAINSRKEICKRGHPLKGSNLLKYRCIYNDRMYRSCRICHNAIQVRYKRRITRERREPLQTNIKE